MGRGHSTSACASRRRCSRVRWAAAVSAAISSRSSTAAATDAGSSRASPDWMVARGDSRPICCSRASISSKVAGGIRLAEAHRPAFGCRAQPVARRVHGDWAARAEVGPQHGAVEPGFDRAVDPDGKAHVLGHARHITMNRRALVQHQRHERGRRRDDGVAQPLQDVVGGAVAACSERPPPAATTIDGAV